MTEHSEALGLEQRCVRPGHWMVNGHDVVRQRDGWWLIYDVGAYGHTWRAIRMTNTLARARDWLKSHR